MNNRIQGKSTPQKEVFTDSIRSCNTILVFKLGISLGGKAGFELKGGFLPGNTELL